jgi:tRNA threonylcarbamoyl adenosine modification protein (Sua5/YciO/YrdC/YwlC family)
MAQYFHIHPTHPQPRLIRRAAEIVRAGGVIVYPTDSSYALGCHLGDKAAMERIRRIRRLGQDHNFTLVVRDLSELAQYARVSNADYRLLKANTPGPYTFILPATREVPRRLQHPRRKTIGLRVPDAPIVRALIAELGEPLASTTLILPDETLPLSDPEEIRARLEHEVDLVIDGGFCGLEPTTVVVLEDGVARIARRGKGDITPFLPRGLPEEERA